MILPIVKVPHPVLREKAKKVVTFDGKLKTILKNMEETLIAAKNPIGVGLAAPQVGISLRIFLTRPRKNSIVRAYINPEILKIEEIQASPDTNEDQSTFEGCLSVDRIWSPIVRPQRVLLKYQTAENITKEEWFEHFPAVIVQHEADHLDGVLFTQRALEQKATIYEEKKGKLKEISM